jgi:hypothetical protein
MTKVREYGELGSPAETVWKLISDFVGFIEVLIESRNAQLETQGDGIGMLRRVTLGDDVVVERLEDLDDASWQTSYSMPVSGPFSIKDYYATIRITPIGTQRCAIDWSGTFMPVGVDEQDAAQAIRAVYTEGIEVLRTRFGA